MPRQVVAAYHMNLQSHQSPLLAGGSDQQDQKATSAQGATGADRDAVLGRSFMVVCHSLKVTMGLADPVLSPKGLRWGHASSDYIYLRSR